ncbi:hypothetical protein BSNK01_14180 [Bacillaceae bacterium]
MRYAWYPVIERFIDHGVGFMPVNKSGIGDQVEVLYGDGSREFLETNSLSFLHQLVEMFGYRYSAIKNVYGKAIGRRKNVPLPLTKGWTLVPFKTRRPTGRQNCQGWFVASAIRGIRRETPLVSVLDLPCHRVTVLSSLETCQAQMNNVILVEHHFRQIHERFARKVSEQRSVYYW